MLDQGNGRVWLVKVSTKLLHLCLCLQVPVPWLRSLAIQITKYLMARWDSIDIEDVHLATLRIYNPSASNRSFSASQS
jgi:hypothetical protein